MKNRLGLIISLLIHMAVFVIPVSFPVNISLKEDLILLDEGRTDRKDEVIRYKETPMPREEKVVRFIEAHRAESLSEIPVQKEVKTVIGELPDELSIKKAEELAAERERADRLARLEAERALREKELKAREEETRRTIAEMVKEPPPVKETVKEPFKPVHVKIQFKEVEKTGSAEEVVIPEVVIPKDGPRTIEPVSVVLNESTPEKTGQGLPFFPSSLTHETPKKTHVEPVPGTSARGEAISSLPPAGIKESSLSVDAKFGDTEFGQLYGPKFIFRETPKYPFRARRLGKEGRVVLRLCIDENGTLLNVEVIEGEGYGFTEAALEAVKKSKYLPAERNGRPIKSLAILPIKFVLRND